MSKNKYIVIIVGTLLVGGGVGGWFWRAQANERKALSRKQTSVESQTLGNSISSDSVPLNGSREKVEASGGLNVDQNTVAASLGQLGGGSEQQGATSGSSAKKTPSPFDPKTFAQYEKYKDGTGALFSEPLAGTGAELTAGRKAAVFYRGWLTNGQLFDESRKGEDGQLQPFVFELGAHQVIAGWEQALAGMKVGAVRMVIVPPSVGYGASGQGSIPGNSVLIFQVQLAAVE